MLKTGPQSRPKNQLHFRDFHETYLISKTLMHSHVSRTWLGSLFSSHINRKFSHFNRRLEFSLFTILNKIQKNFCEGLGLLIRIQTIIILEPRDYKKSILQSQFQSFQFQF
jgi:hypothetical protein